MIEPAPEESEEKGSLRSPGIMTLYLLGAWLEEGPRAVAARSWRLRAARELIARMSPYDPAKTHLTRIVDVMQSAKSAQISLIVPPLMTYGRVLEVGAHWASAAHVYRAILAHVDPVAEAAVAIPANMQLGFCLRTQARWDEAITTYRTAGQLALAVGDVGGAIKSVIADAKVASDQGNISAAETILDEAIQRATEAELPELRSLALQERGGIARRIGDAETAIRCIYKALDDVKTPAARERVISDLASVLCWSGLRSAAREALLFLVATAQEQYVRWVCLVNLLAIAALDGQESAFEQYRHELAYAQLPAFLATHYHCAVGDGYRRLKQPVKARAAFKRALDLATQHHIDDIRRQAEQGFDETRGGGASM